MKTSGKVRTTVTLMKKDHKIEWAYYISLLWNFITTIHFVYNKHLVRLKKNKYSDRFLVYLQHKSYKGFGPINLCLRENNQGYN